MDGEFGLTGMALIDEITIDISTDPELSRLYELSLNVANYDYLNIPASSKVLPRGL